jgi:hypothetical protein
VGGSAAFSCTFRKQWKQDGFPDYINSEAVLPEEAAMVLRRLLEAGDPTHNMAPKHPPSPPLISEEKLAQLLGKHQAAAGLVKDVIAELG